MRRQKFDWDCAVACVAEALEIEYEDASIILDAEKIKTDKGCLPGYVFKCLIECGFSCELLNYNYAGPLNKTILQVSSTQDRLAHHYVWIDSDGNINCPANHFTAWARIQGIGMGIRITEKNP